jgi:hypothetical protein
VVLVTRRRWTKLKKITLCVAPSSKTFELRQNMDVWLQVPDRIACGDYYRYEHRLSIKLKYKILLVNNKASLCVIFRRIHHVTGCLDLSVSALLSALAQRFTFNVTLSSQQIIGLGRNMSMNTQKHPFIIWWPWWHQFLVSRMASIRNMAGCNLSLHLQQVLLNS